MMIIGLTGGSGSGKGAVCRILEEFNIPTIDTDAVYREMTASDSPCTRALSEEFGEKIISITGKYQSSEYSTINAAGLDLPLNSATSTVPSFTPSKCHRPKNRKLMTTAISRLARS